MEMVSSTFVMFDEIGTGRSKAVAAATQLGLIDHPTLAQNTPNRFNSSTEMRFRTAVDAALTLSVYDLLGQKIRELANRTQPAGEHVLFWDGRDAAGRDVASGTYIYRLRSAGAQVQRKLLLLR
jgi:flagellar hook assembly protein FlgD